MYMRKMSTILIVSVSLLSMVMFAQEPWRETRLFNAVVAGEIDVVKAALVAGKDPNTRGPGFVSLLAQATAFKQIDIIKLLLANGANPKAKGNEGLVGLAVETGRMDILACLVEAGAPVVKPKESCIQSDVLVSATRKGRVDFVRYLLQHGADPRGTWALGDTTALQAAAAMGNVDIIALLLEVGADINHRDWNGLSALMHACKEGKLAAVEFLLAHGADTSFQDGYGETAGTFAAQLKGENTKKLQALCAGKSN